MPVFAAVRPFHPAFSLFGRFTTRFRVVAGEQTVDGRRCMILRDYPVGSAQLAVVVYLDPERDFCIIRLSSELKGKEQSRTAFNEYRQVDGQWIPIRWTTAFPGSTTTESTAVEFALNGHVEPDELQLEFPYGTWLNDGPDRFIVKEGGSRRVITARDRGHSYDELLRTEAGAFGPVEDRTSVRRWRLANMRRSQVIALRGRQIWTVLIAKDADVEARIESVNSPDAGAREPARCALDPSSRDQLLFGRSRDERQARKLLPRLVEMEIDSVDRACKLTPAQKEKLQVAGRGDIERFFKSVAELKPRTERIYDENDAEKGELDEAIESLLKDSKTLRNTLDSGEFGGDSLFGKTLKATLTPDQAAAYEAARAKSTEHAEPGEGARRSSDCTCLHAVIASPTFASSGLGETRLHSQ
jgi:hypothetical protein